MTVDVMSSTAPPSWWREAADEVTIFARPDWLAAADRTASDQSHLWFRTDAGGGHRPAGMRGTVVTEDSARGSINPYHWLFEPTAYRDGAVCPDRSGLEAADLLPSLVFVYPGLEFSLVGAPRSDEAVRLLRAASCEAAERGLRSVALGFVQAHDTVLRRAAVGLDYLEAPMATLSTLEISGRTAEEVFASYGTKQRASFRRTRRLLEREGVSVRELEDPSGHLETLTELRCAHLEHYGHIFDPDRERRHLERILATFGDQITVLVAKRESRTRAFALFLADGDTLHSYMVGKLDPDVDRHVYFELNFYAAAEHAASRRFARISYGYGTEEAKRLRGCHQEPAYCYLLPLYEDMRERLGQLLPL